ncbi:hypothetical protein Acr_03g0013050 [Actinidia rufa]|uniref:Uncharacterized protein n=1 Tax=Actinidia rufa TaxID=165716 RepID=A0A7J0EDJ7_9ERIC|nr:hypothetical protein Acr_03g0013050 [Actinidia rufa]
MADEVTQLPSLPQENPPSPEASPSIATPSPIERETNIMTKNELDLLKESHSFPSSIQIKLPEEDEIIASTHSGEVGKEPAWRISQQCQGMEEEILFHHERRREFSLGTSRDTRIPRVPRSWGIPGKFCNKLHVMSTVEQERLQAILDSISGGKHFIIKEVFESKFFSKCFKVATQSMASNEGNKGNNPPTGSATLIAGDGVNPTIPETNLDKLEFKLKHKIRAMSMRISLKKIAQKVGESNGKSSAIKSTPTKGVVIGEKRPREVFNILPQ